MKKLIGFIYLHLKYEEFTILYLGRKWFKYIASVELSVLHILVEKVYKAGCAWLIDYLFFYSVIKYCPVVKIDVYTSCKLWYSKNTMVLSVNNRKQ